jgi:hypothetical protein
MSRIWVTLTAKETDAANRVGADRRLRAVQRGAAHNHGFNGTDAEALLIMQKGARCELAAHIGLKTNYWDTSPIPGGADLDGWIDVKERTAFFHFLNVPQNSTPDYAYVSVCSEKAPAYAIDGWCYGHEIMYGYNLRNWRADRPPMFGLNATRYVAPIKTPQQLMAIVQRKLAKR